jgi:hypothetical protein
MKSQAGRSRPQEKDCNIRGKVKFQAAPMARTGSYPCTSKAILFKSRIVSTGFKGCDMGGPESHL